MNDPLFYTGRLFIGCNYWASNAGIHMWQEWDESAIVADLTRLEEAKLTILRVFPLWPDFQPLHMLKQYTGQDYEVRMGETPLPFTEAGKAGIDEVMADRFERFLALCEEHHLQVIVGLLTGWMSGRMFVPQLLESCNLLTDSLALTWETKFVKYMVRRFRSHPAIAAWDLGNECNCMGKVATANDAYLWASAITNAIKSEDQKHPVFSGMHSQAPQGLWPQSDMGEIVDALCTHPYPLFTPYCHTDPINTMKSELHASTETNYYEDLSGKPCFVEEAGTLGNMICNEEVSADYVSAVLADLWANGCHGFLWWCANDQLDLDYAPYDWCAIERELGLLRRDGSPKPVLSAMTDFASFLERHPDVTLSHKIQDAVCILTRDQEQWAVAYGANILAKQAKLDLRFAYVETEIPQSNVYLLPSMRGGSAVPRRVMAELLNRVREGATLYLSSDSVLLSSFSEFTGLKVLTRCDCPSNTFTVLNGQKIQLSRPVSLVTESCGATVLATDGDGHPLLSVNAYGNGKVYFLNAPVELIAAKWPAATNGYPLFSLFYEAMKLRSPAKVVTCSCQTVGITEHPINEHSRYVVLVNYAAYEQELTLETGDWNISSAFSISGKLEQNGKQFTIPHHSGAVLLLEK